MESSHDDEPPVGLSINTDTNAPNEEKPPTTNSSPSPEKEKKNEKASFAIETPRDHGKDGGEEKEATSRGNWANRTEFMLSAIGYSVGLGNVWRFPYLCYKNGGGAFLVPYTIVLFAAGLPLFILELGLGQFTSRGCIGVWDCAPLFKGLGWGMVILSGIVGLYYNMVIAYTIFYFFASFKKTLPWSSCNNEWNSNACEYHHHNGTTYNATSNATRPAQEYWNNYVLGRNLSDGLHDMGPIRWKLCLCLLLAWTIVFFCLIKGIKSSGKVVYFTAVFPYVVLFILLIRGVTLPGAGKGIEFYIKPRFDHLGNALVWKDAAVQLFYSLGPAWGGLHTMASYNKFDTNFQRDGIIIAITNCGTSVFAGFVIFSVIGYMSHDSGIPIQHVATDGPGLAFVAYPEALARMPGAAFWAIMFFFMLFTLGLDSMFVGVETCITATVEELDHFFPNIHEKKTFITLGFCIFCFFLGLPLTTNGGIYLLTLMDTYSAGFSVTLIAVSESLIISYVYGINTFLNDMYAMLNYRMNIYWKVCWMAICPVTIGGIFIFFCISYTPMKYEDYVIPPWAEFRGWCMVLVSLFPTPIYMAYFLWWHSPGDTLLERLRYATKPAKSWGPALDEDRLKASYPVRLL